MSINPLDGTCTHMDNNEVKINFVYVVLIDTIGDYSSR